VLLLQFLPLPLQVSAVILSAAKGPDQPTAAAFGPFQPKSANSFLCREWDDRACSSAERKSQRKLSDQTFSFFAVTAEYFHVSWQDFCPAS
jgi:hypothetical protein